MAFMNIKLKIFTTYSPKFADLQQKLKLKLKPEMNTCCDWLSFERKMQNYILRSSLKKKMTLLNRKIVNRQLKINEVFILYKKYINL